MRSARHRLKVLGLLSAALLQSELLTAADAGSAATSGAMTRATKKEAGTALAPLELVDCDQVVRPPALFRLRLIASVPSERFDDAGYALDISLERGDELLASDQVHLDRLGQLSAGIEAVLSPVLGRGPTTALPAHLSVVLTSSDHHRQVRVSRELPTAGSLAHQLTVEQGLLRARHEASPLPWLWWEQGQEIATAPESSERCRDLLGLLSLLAAADTGTLPASPLIGAWRDPVDASVQPERYHRVDGALVTAWVLATPSTPVAKSDWPALLPAWLAAAAAARCVVIETYPAGDRDWQGIAAMRALSRMQDRRAGRVLLVAAAGASQAALRLANGHPELFLGVRLVDPGQGLLQVPSGMPLTISRTLTSGARTAAQLDPESPAFWTTPLPASVLGPVAGAGPPLPAGALSRLCAYARQPFVVVVGMGEHRAAQEDDLALAHAFIAAWAQHAHGLPPAFSDAEFDPERWKDHAWVLIGNTRSNRILAQLAHRHVLPVSWDGRQLTLRSTSYPRADRRCVAFSFERPDHGLAVVLDGSANWPAEGLPLSGVADPWNGPPLPPSPLAPIDTPP